MIRVWCIKIATACISVISNALAVSHNNHILLGTIGLANKKRERTRRMNFEVPVCLAVAFGSDHAIRRSPISFEYHSWLKVALIF